MCIKYQTKGVAIASGSSNRGSTNHTRRATNILHNHILLKLRLQNRCQYTSNLIHRSTRRKDRNNFDGALAWPITYITLGDCRSDHAKGKQDRNDLFHEGRHNGSFK